MSKQISIFRTNIRHCLTETPDDAQSEKHLRFTENLNFYTFGSFHLSSDPQGDLKSHDRYSAPKQTQKRSSPNAFSVENVC